MSELKITSVKIIPLSYRYQEDEKWKWSGGTKLQRNVVLSKIETNKGITGIGEIGESSFLPQSIKEIVKEQFQPMLLNENPLNIELLYKKMYTRSAHWGRRGVIIPVISGLEIALWDIISKYFDKPLYNLLGGKYRKKIKVYASAGMDKSLDMLQQEVKSYEKKGYKGVKIRIGQQNISEDIQKVKIIRETLSENVKLMVDAGQCYVDFPWNFNKAFRCLKKLENLDLLWIEEPLHPDNIEGYGRLSSQIDIPVAAGENEYTKDGFKNLVTENIVDIIQPDVTRAGGILECKKIAGMAEAYHMNCAPHIFGSGVSLMANMHFILSTPNILIMEYDRTINPLREKLLLQSPEFENGYVFLPEDIPGLGVKLTDEIIEQFPYKPLKAVEKGDFRPEGEDR